MRFSAGKIRAEGRLFVKKLYLSVINEQIFVD